LKLSKISTHARLLPGTTPPPTARQSGFSVIEAMVGFLVLGITIAALFGGFSFGFNTIKLSQEEVRADQILVQKLESLRVYNWTNVIAPGYIPNSIPAYYSTSNAAHGVTYNVQISVTPFVPSATPESYSSSLRQVTASVSWFSEGMNHTRTMMTLVSSNGIATFQP
jgi:Tfp pilus assembly protein PilV